MWNYYHAKPHHFILSALMVWGGSALIVSNPIAAFIIIGIGIESAIWIYSIGHYTARQELNESIDRIAEKLLLLDSEKLRALGIAFPELRVYPGKQGPHYTIEDTGIPIEILRQFMDDSDPYQFAPVRNYGDGTRDRKNNQKVAGFLLERGHLQPDSASGNHGLLWYAGHYEFVKNSYLNESTQLIELEPE